MSAPASNSNYTAFTLKSPSLHFATMTGLAPSTQYFYRVGDPSAGWSDTHAFTTAPPVGPAAYPVNFLTYGDMGVSNSEDTAALTAQLLAAGEATFIVHR
jgi:hypothetical protein